MEFIAYISSHLVKCIVLTMWQVVLLSLLGVATSSSPAWDGTTKLIITTTNDRPSSFFCGSADVYSSFQDQFEFRLVAANPINGGCDSADEKPHMINGSAVTNNGVFFQRRNCTFADLSALSESYGAVAVIIGNRNGTNVVAPFANESKIPVVMVPEDFRGSFPFEDSSAKIMLQKVFVDEGSRFLPVVIILMATFCVVAGSIWATEGERRAPKYEPLNGGGYEDDNNREENNSEEKSPINGRWIVMFLCFASVFLVLLYFFFDYLVYLLFGVFALFGALGIFVIIVAWTPESFFQPEIKLPFIGATTPYTVAVTVFSLSLGAWWIFARNTWYGWILQDTLGVCFLITAISQLKVPNLKLATVFLAALLVYDVFFVFITPLFTHDGSSVMVHAATGNPDADGCFDKMLPFLLKIPRSQGKECMPCPRDMALGFGDIVLPSLLVSFCMRFDYRTSNMDKPYFVQRHVYGVAATLAYIAGLIAAFVALTLSQMAQPALLYLSPITCGTIWTLAKFRGDLGDMLRGFESEHRE